MLNFDENHKTKNEIFSRHVACPPISVLPVFIDSTEKADNASTLGASLAEHNCPFVRLGKDAGNNHDFALNKKPGMWYQYSRTSTVD